MNLTSEHSYHIFNRGNQRQQIFFTRENYFFFLQKVLNELRPHCEILAYCLMPNHFHLLVHVHKPADEEETGTDRVPILNRKIGTLQSSYTRALQNQELFTGSLFQQKTKAVQIKTDSQLLTCLNYIHQNPMKAKLVEKMEDWEFSSFREYCKLRDQNFCNQSLLHSFLQYDENDFYNMSYQLLPEGDVRSIF
jgi:putative transposase